jgi:hypothetical protein
VTIIRTRTIRARPSDIWQPSPRVCIAGRWPKQKIGHPVWQNMRVKWRFDTDFPGERARRNFTRRHRSLQKRGYQHQRREAMAFAAHAWRTGYWKRWAVLMRPGVLQAKRGIVA